MGDAHLASKSRNKMFEKRLLSPNSFEDKKQASSPKRVSTQQQSARCTKCLDGPQLRYWSPKAIIDSLGFHSYSLWLFTASDLKTIVGPSLVFGVANALAILSYELDVPIYRTNQDVGRRIPHVAFWIWTNLLPFTINNQTAAGAVEEDMINKPWRNLPARRMTVNQARQLMLFLYPLAVITSFAIGGLKQSIALVILGVWYNNFAGGDRSCLLRNLINAYGYVCFTSGAMEVAAGVVLPLDVRLIQWLGMIAAVMFSTVHLQDMYDQAGDQIRGRNTVPLVVGDGRARWTTALAMIFRGFVCPLYWHAEARVLLASFLLASWIATRGLLLRTVSDDRLTFKLWNAWMTLTFQLPLLCKMSRAK